MLFKKAFIPNLKFFKFKTGRYSTTYQAKALRLLAFSGEPAPGRNQRLEIRVLMPQWITESKNADSPIRFQDIDSNWRAFIKMPHLVRSNPMPG